MKLSCKAKQDEFTAKISEAFDFDFDGEIVTEIRDLPELPEDYSIGVIVGPSGSGKSTLLNTIGTQNAPLWGNRSVGSHLKTLMKWSKDLVRLGLIVCHNGAYLLISFLMVSSLGVTSLAG